MWLLKTDTEGALLVEVTYLTLDLLGYDTLTFADTCRNTLHNGSVILRTNWGQRLQSVRSFSPCLAVIFQTDGWREDAGFEFEISRIDFEEQGNYNCICFKSLSMLIIIIYQEATAKHRCKAFESPLFLTVPLPLISTE